MKSIAVVSGKGGVGKSTVALNLALAFGDLGEKALLVDADMALPNLDVLAGVSSAGLVGDFALGEATLAQACVRLADKVELLGGSPRRSAEIVLPVCDRVLMEGREFDVAVFDAATGLANGAVELAERCDVVLLVTEPEPGALLDGLCFLEAARHAEDCRILVNRVSGPAQAQTAAQALAAEAVRQSSVKPGFAGHVLEDERFRRAARRRKPYLLAHPFAGPSRQLRKIAKGLLQPRNAGAELELAPSGSGGSLREAA
ncbi:MAG: P-loop NTPase [Fimbriimonadaceae bacterium]|nr:MAG: P-loop NTPase [Fimbriimonadaceae bacterium]